MKPLMIILICLLSSFHLFSQDNNLKTPPNKNQPKIAIKVNPINLAFNNYKLTVDIAIDTKRTLEIQGGIKNHRYPNYNITEKNYLHGQIRYKRDLLPDTKNLSGIYFAPGLTAGQWSTFHGPSDDIYATAFCDLGFQISVNSIVFEYFLGLGATITTAEFSQPAAGDMFPEMDILPNSATMQGFSLRSGIRIGYQF